MTDPVADVAVVGGGTAGVAAARALAETGCRVVILDGGQPVAARPVSFDIDGIDLSPRIRQRGGRPELDAYITANHLVPQDFTVVGLLGGGGLGSVWGCGASAFDAADMKGWPLSPADLAPSYRRVAEHIGISGRDDDDLADFHGRGLPLHPAPPLGPAAALVLERYRRRRGRLGDGIRLGQSRLALLTRPIGPRGACTLDQRCFSGCPVGALYDSGDDLRSLARDPRIDLRSGHIVTRLAALPGGGTRISGLRSAAAGPARAPFHLDVPAVILAAGHFASTRLGLDRLGLAGRSHPFQSAPSAHLAFLLISRLGAPPPAAGFAATQLTLRLEVPELQGYAMASMLDAEALSAADLALRLPTTVAGSRTLLGSLVPAMMPVVVFWPGNADAHRLELVPDPEGPPQLRIIGHPGSGVSAAAAATRRRLQHALGRLGLVSLPGSFRLRASGSGVHYAGGLAMGRLSDADGALHGAPGVFVADGAALPTMPAKSPTFTLMAHADRVGRLLGARLRKVPVVATVTP